MKLATLPISKGIDRLGSGTYLNFADAQHGWVELRQPTSSAFSFGDLLSTSDGGATWQMLPAPPLIENMLFTSVNVGYLFEGDAGRELYRTGDGGNSWQQLSLLDTTKLYKSNSLELSAPSFSDPDHGFITLTVSGSGARFFRSNAFTNDGGKTWVSKPIDYSRPLTVATDSIQVPMAKGEVTVHLLPGKGLITTGFARTDITASVPEAIDRHSSVSATAFSGNDDGWVLMHSGYCNAAKTKCPQTDTLLMTGDGGATYKNVTPRGKQTSLNPGESAVDAGVQAWDQRDAPSPKQINAWVGQSPFSAVGLYIGGINYKGDRSNLSPEYAQNLSCIGLDIVPLWVGPQSLTSTGNYFHMPPNSNTAYTYGQDGARTSVNRAIIELGLGSELSTRMKRGSLPLISQLLPTLVGLSHNFMHWGGRLVYTCRPTIGQI